MEVESTTWQLGSARIVGDLDSVRFSGGTSNLARLSLVASTKPNESVILKISESGGPVTPVTKLDPARSEVIHLAPVFLPMERILPTSRRVGRHNRREFS